MASSIDFRPQNRDLDMVVRELDRAIDTLLGMRIVENEGNDHVLVENSDEVDGSRGPNSDLLLSPNPLLPEDEISNGDGISTKSEQENKPKESANSLATENIKPLSSGPRKTTRKSETHTFPKKSNSSTTYRSSLPSAKIIPCQSRTTKSSTPTDKPSIRSPKLIVPSRKTGPASSKNYTPTVKCRPSKTSVTLALSRECPQKTKISTAKNPISDYSNSNFKQRRNSFSPSRTRPTNRTCYKPMRSRGLTNGDDDVNPVLMGTKMVERVVNMRKLAPPKQNDYLSENYSKKNSRENSGFGRSLSKKSLDMAIRHMDIRRSICDNIRHVATSNSAPITTVDVSESSLATSSDGSEHRLCTNNKRFLDGRE